MPGPVTRTTRDPVICPACGRCSLSELVPRPALNATGIRLRCRGCGHQWPLSADTPCVPPFPTPEPTVAVLHSFAGHPFYDAC
jgi:hypothetical protein